MPGLSLIPSGGGGGGGDGLSEADVIDLITTHAPTPDLSALATDAELATAVASAVASVISPGQLADALAPYATSEAMTTAVASAIDPTELGAALMAYVDTGDLTTALADYVASVDLQDAVDAALATFEPEAFQLELAAAEKTATQTMTGVSTVGATPTAVTGLALDVTGNGRPIEFRFDAPAVWHSVANTLIVAVLMVDGAVAGIIGASASPSTTGGTSLRGFRRLIIPDGETHQYSMAIYATAAGNVTLSASASVPVAFSATSR